MQGGAKLIRRHVAETRPGLYVFIVRHPFLDSSTSASVP
jgi:hypothetical protein